ncbi:MAG: DUF2288 domain-containing protein [Betaproteobacteria bacterium]|nr:DUF2288 domain-containing protein [Betaproteobacteria bacterium]
MSQNIDALRVQLNSETAKADWSELLPFFAKGQLLHVDSALDLIDVAAHIAADHAPSVQTWLTTGRLSKLDDATAQDWQARNPPIWTVVVAPWILVQERAH